MMFGHLKERLMFLHATKLQPYLGSSSSQHHLKDENELVEGDQVDQLGSDSDEIEFE